MRALQLLTFFRMYCRCASCFSFPMAGAGAGAGGGPPDSATDATLADDTCKPAPPACCLSTLSLSSADMHLASL